MRIRHAEDTDPTERNGRTARTIRSNEIRLILQTTKRQTPRGGVAFRSKGVAIAR